MNFASDNTAGAHPDILAAIVAANEGRTMLIVTHDMRMAADISDTVVFLHQGKIEEQGDPADILVNPQTERLKQFLSATAPA